MTRNIFIAIALLLSPWIAGCVADTPTGSTHGALTGEQCEYFNVNGKVRICHKTSSTTHPYTILNINNDACIQAHSDHAEDYVAVGDPTCQGGGCLPVGAPWDPTLPCCENLVVQNGVCVDLCAGVTCTAQDQCHVAGTCDPQTGLCDNPAAADGTGCTDGNACTQTDTCQAGACVGANPVDCSASDVCHVAGTCDPQSGTCSTSAAPDGTPCADHNWSCQAGVCSAPILSFQLSFSANVSRANGVAAADFNGDGKLDVAVSSLPNVSVFFGNGDGTLGTSANTYSAGPLPNAVVARDFNGDGYPDIAVTTSNSTTKTVGVLINKGDGTGTFKPVVNYSLGTSWPVALAAADFNGDGYLDIATGHTNGTVVKLLLNKGDGTGAFYSPQNVSNGTSIPTSVATGDFNGDGLTDLAVTNQWAASIGVLLGNGDGTFQSPVTLATSFILGYYSGITVNDINNDGKSDIVAMYGTVNTFFGNGDGTFQAPIASTNLSTGTSMVTTVDFTGDGWLDLASGAYQQTSAIVAARGMGDGTFQQPTTVEGYIYVTNASSVGVGDMDGNGKPDLLITYLSTVKLYLNTSH